MADADDGRADKAPDAFRTISEVAEDLNLPQHVLRFWETRFSQIRPMKRAGGRRYYRPADIDLLKGIRHLLYGEGYTIRGVQRILKEEGVATLVAVGRGEAQAAKPAVADNEPKSIAVAPRLPLKKQEERLEPSFAKPAPSPTPMADDELEEELEFDYETEELAEAYEEEFAADEAVHGLTEDQQQLLHEAMADLAAARKLLLQD